MTNLAPIVLFVYNRPWHTEQTLEALMQNELADQSTLYIIADGAKENITPEQLQKIQEVRQVIRQKQWCKEVYIEEKEKNWGLADSIIDGVTRIVNQYGKIIVLEDDIVTSPYFLRFMNDALNIYENESNIYSVTGYAFPIDTEEVTCFLSPLAFSSWSWGTWADKWQCFDKAIPYKSLIQQNNWLRRRFNFADYNYADMLNNNNSWAIRWYYSVFIRNGLGVFPTKNLVENIGFDGSGLHYTTIVEVKTASLYQFPISVSLSKTIDMNFYAMQMAYFETNLATTQEVAKKNDLNMFLKKCINFVLKK